MESETGFPSSHQLKSYVASKSRLKLAARAVLSADAGLLVVLSLYRFKKFCEFCLRDGDVPVLGSEARRRIEQREADQGDDRSDRQWPDVPQ